MVRELGNDREESKGSSDAQDTVVLRERTGGKDAKSFSASLFVVRQHGRIINWSFDFMYQ
jgi:hypothetical protein